jgi:hypothetical protein
MSFAPTSGDVLKEHFIAALGQLRAGRYSEAAASFAAVEAECPPTFTTYRVLAKSRRAGALFALRRWSEALVLLDELVADTGSLATIDRQRFPDEVATIYAARAGCLEMLKLWTRARDSVADLIAEVGSGETPRQRFYVADGYLLQAKAALARREFSTAFRAIEAAITQCESVEYPGVAKVRRQAEELQQSVQARVRTVR